MGGFSYPDHFVFEAEPMPEIFGAGVAGVFLIVYLLILLFVMALSTVTYVLHSLGLYTIAKRRRIDNSWLAWLPLGNLWILGNISDQYQYVVKGKVKSRRKILLGVGIGLIAGYFLWLFITLINLAAGKEGVALLLLIFGGLAIIAAAILLAVFQYMAYYDLYRSCDPSDAGLFLALSILFSGIMAFFVFACRKKDLGMPPRKQPAPQPVFETVTEAPAEEPVTEEGFAQPEEFEE